MEKEAKKIVVCRLTDTRDVVKCDVYQGGNFLYTKELPVEKLKEVFE